MAYVQKKLWPKYTFGLLLCQQIMFLASGLNTSHLDLGKTITRVVSKNFTNIYVGGVNFIARLSPDLKLLENFTIGPVKNAQHCAPNPAPCDNIVTILEIDTDHDMLLVCGSAYKGTCTFHSLLSINNWYCLYGDSNNDDGVDVVSGVYQHASTIHFLQPTDIKTEGSAKINLSRSNCRTADFGNGSRNDLNSSAQKSTSKLASNLMVAGSLYNSNFPVNRPFLSLRNITFHGSHYMIGYTKDQNSRPVGFNVSNRSSTSEMPEYKLSFTWGNFSYFLFLQQSTTHCDKSSPCIVTKISRTCQDSSSIFPYIEMPLSCENSDINKKYRILTSAVLGQVGLLQSSYKTVPILVMAFGNVSEPLAKTADPKYGTAICAVTLDQIEFDYLLDACAEGQNYDIVRHASWITGQNESCRKETIQRNRCWKSNTRNKYIQHAGFGELWSTLHIKDVSVVFIQTLTPYTMNGELRQNPAERMNVFLLTNEGKFKKFRLRARQRLKIIEAIIEGELSDSFELMVNVSSPMVNVSSPMVGITDNDEAVTYAVSGQKIMQIALDSCMLFQTCSDCWKGNKCGWCPKEKKCIEKELAQLICQSAGEVQCPPQLTDFNPKIVPSIGGSILKLAVSLLGYEEGVSEIRVDVCNQSCDNILIDNTTVTCQVPKKCQGCSSTCNITLFTKWVKEIADGNTSSFCLPNRPVLEYVIPNVTSFSPMRGPAFGGTTITFRGQHLKAGSSTKIMIGDGQCIVNKLDTHNLVCQVEEDNQRQPGSGEVKISIDNFSMTLVNEKFHFLANPKVTSMRPMQTIASGGVTLTIEGQHLNSTDPFKLTIAVPSPKHGSNLTSTTEVPANCSDHGNKIICTTPDVTQLYMDTRSISVNITLYMNGQDLMGQLSKSHKFIIHGDPIISSSEDFLISKGAETIDIKGERIPFWINYSEIIVHIGNITLDVITVTSNYIKCNVTEAIAAYGFTSVNESGSKSNTTTSVSINRTDSSGTTKSYVTTISQKFIVTTITPTKTTARNGVTKSTGFSQKPQELKQSNYLNSEPETNTSITSVDSFNVTQTLTSTRPHSNKSTSSTKKALKYKIKLRIGNYEKILGFVTFEDGNKVASTEEKPGDEDLYFITGAVGAGIVFLILSIVSCVLYMRAKRARALVKEQAFYMSSLSGSQHGSTERALPSLKQILQSVMEPEKRADMDRLIISLDCLTLGKTIGSGNFGCVFEGLLSMDKETQAQKIAVKTLQDPSSHNIDFHAFVKEAIIMREFQHPHVLGLIALAEKEPGIPYVILPYMDNGDLLTFVRDSSVSLSLHDVIKFGADIASGMAYLSTLKFVHRDLAARNCMLDDQYRVKVADFGLCRDIYEKGYYTSDNRKKLPIRWMAVESIEHGEYSSKSDVWSFGVVLWELLSRGVTPYPGVNGWDVINFLRQRRLAPPYFCPDEMYDLMMQCWAKDPNLRPDFNTTQTVLLGFIGQSPAITDTIKRRRGDAVHIYNNQPIQDNLTINNTTENVKDRKSKSESNIINNKVKKEAKITHQNTQADKNGQEKKVESTNLDSNKIEEKLYANLLRHTNTVINNVLIVIPTCYSQKDVSKTAAGVYIQIVDNYEPPPKFTNPFLRSIKKHSQKHHDRSTKVSKKNYDSKTDSSGYSFPGEYPEFGGSNEDMVNDFNDSRPSVSIMGSKEKNYYELETNSLRSSAASDSRSAWSMLNNTGSNASILDTQSQDSSASNGCISGSTSLTVPHNHSLQHSSSPGFVVKKLPSAAPRKLKPIK